MVLLFLLTLAGFSYLILGEMEKREQARLANGDARVSCACGQAVRRDWLLCPACAQLLRVSCTFCGRLKARLLRFCPHCGSADEQGGT
ncbi:double zinc ribbon domain-containing protein [Geoalkalibacter sp.]|uniref:double zinc ribbon domain-containing protein n=1 Tax=Geoalkalibacter sp. TaxID=3041440 RepID=UPI00272E762C|nr:zinc ribbon domain-containing protein [Geoalkalibacter sp.]